MVNVPPWVGTEWEEKGNWPITDFDKYMVHVGNLTGGDIERYVVHRNYVANTTTPFNLNFCRNILITGLSKHNFANPPPPNSTQPPPTNRWQYWYTVFCTEDVVCTLNITVRTLRWQWSAPRPETTLSFFWISPVNCLWFSTKNKKIKWNRNMRPRFLKINNIEMLAIFLMK